MDLTNVPQNDACGVEKGTVFCLCYTHPTNDDVPCQSCAWWDEFNRCEECGELENDCTCEYTPDGELACPTCYDRGCPDCKGEDDPREIR